VGDGRVLRLPRELVLGASVRHAHGDAAEQRLPVRGRDRENPLRHDEPSSTGSTRGTDTCVRLASGSPPSGWWGSPDQAGAEPKSISCSDWTSHRSNASGFHPHWTTIRL